MSERMKTDNYGTSMELFGSIITTHQNDNNRSANLAGVGQFLHYVMGWLDVAELFLTETLKAAETFRS